VDKQFIVDTLVKVLNVDYNPNDLISLSFLIVVSFWNVDENNFQNGRQKLLFKERLNQKLLNINKLNVLDKDIYGSLRKFAIRVQFSRQLQLKYQTFDSNALYFHISDKIPLNQEIFENWMSNNPNPKILVEKVINDISDKSGYFQKNDLDIFKKRIDDVARFLEFEACACTAVCFAGGNIFIAMNKCNEKRYYNFKKHCKDMFYFLQRLVKCRLSNDEEKDESMIIIHQSYSNSCASEIIDKRKLLKYYEDLENNQNAGMHDQNDLLFVKCKLFIKIKNFVKDLDMVDSENFWIDVLKLRNNEEINIIHISNKSNIHCEVFIYDYIKSNFQDEICYNYIGISELCCPICYFVVSQIRIDVRGCHPVVYFWPVPEFYIKNIKEFHGAIFAMNYELSNYVKDIIKCVKHLPFVMKFRQKDSKIYSFKDRIPAVQYADLNT
jgi:hypothetical protein